MPGMFDDLIPGGASAPSGGGGMFDDLIPKAQQPSVAEDMGKSALSGAAQGVVGLPGIPGNLVSMGKDVGHWINSKLYSPETVAKFEANREKIAATPPTSGQVIGAYENATGQQFYEPKTVPGQYARTIAEFAPNAVGGPGNLAQRVASRVVAPGVFSETAGQVTKGTAAEPYARMAGALIPSAAGSVKRAVTGTPREAPSLEDLYQAAHDKYDMARNYGIEIKPAPVARLADNIFSDLHNDGFRQLNVPKTWSTIEELKNPAGRNVTVDDIDSVRKALLKAGSNPMEGAERAAAGKAIDAIDKYVSSLGRNQGHIAVNPQFAGSLANTIGQARGNWAAMKRADLVEGKVQSATDRAMSTGAGANVNNATRQNIRQILNNAKLRRGFSDDEIAQMRQIVRGTVDSNLARRVGKLSPEGIVSDVGGIHLGHLAAGKSGAFALPLIGKIAKVVGDKLTERRVRELSEMVRLRSPLGSTYTQQPVRPVIPLGDYGSAGLLGQSSAQEQGHAAGGRTDGGPADSISEDQDEALSRSMTHWPEAPNPAQPYLQGTKDFLKGGISQVLRGQGAQLPDWSNRVSDLAQSEGFNTAIGMATPLKGETIVAPAISLGEGAYYSGINHAAALERAAIQRRVSVDELLKHPQLDAEGFLTSSGRYVGRDEAGQIAERSGQTYKDNPHDPLIAEDLDPEAEHFSSETRAKMKGAQSPSITAYHGSPHDFDRFDLSRIGTGEGSQAYGHGLYFAENEKVAQDYKSMAGKARFQGTMEEEDAALALQFGGNREAAIKRLQDAAASYRDRAKIAPANIGGGWNVMADQQERAVQLLQKGWEPPKGKMYQVSIKADPQHFLDWDKPLSEQSEHVKKVLTDMGVPDRPHVTGDAAYHHLVGDEIAAGRVRPQSTTAGNVGYGVVTDKLRAAGIPGIKYLDQGSRNTFDLTDLKRSLNYWQKSDSPEAAARIKEVQQAIAAEEAKPVTRNFVVFDDRLIDIMKKYGIAGIGALPALGMYHYQDKDDLPKGRARGGRIIGAKSQSEVGLAQNEAGTTFRCGTCKYFKKGQCWNENPELHGRKVKPHWCCNLYDHAGMKVIA